MNESRIQRVIAHMREEGLKQIIVSAPQSVYYLTGTFVSPGERMLALLVRDDGTVTLFANRLFALNGNTAVPLVEFDDTEDPIEMLQKQVKAGKIGIDKFWPSQFTIRLMNARSDIQPVLGSRPVDLARMMKDEEELNLMRKASRLNDEVTQKTIENLQEGMTELEACELYLKFAKQLGADGPS